MSDSRSCTRSPQACDLFDLRYKNILPFDDTRVVLKAVPGVVGSDYVNANYINGEASGTEKAYIASQGPLKATVPQFWQVP